MALPLRLRIETLKRNPGKRSIDVLFYWNARVWQMQDGVSSRHPFIILLSFGF
jgi:hypothetical protein